MPSAKSLDPALTANVTAAVEQTMKKLMVPGAVVLIRTKDGEYLKAFGTRRIGVNEPVTVDDHFRIGSNTKTLTGTVLLQLVDEGLLSVDDPVSKFRPDVPNGQNITIGQLLDMRSGLNSYSVLTSFNQTLDDDPKKAWDPEQLVKMGLAERPKFVPPGSGWFYSNTNTVIAGLIVEKLTGKALRDVFQERIFQKLGLKNTSLPERTDSSMPAPYANGYMYGTNVSTIKPPGLSEEEQQAAWAGTLLPNDHTLDNPSWGWAAGGAISDARDLATYVKALVDGGLLSDRLQAERLASLKPTPEGKTRYGWALAALGPLLGHDGSLPGYQSVMGHDPKTGTTLIVLTNLQASPDGRQTANVIAQALIGLLNTWNGKGAGR